MQRCWRTAVPRAAGFEIPLRPEAEDGPCKGRTTWPNERKKIMETSHAQRICDFRLKLPTYGGSYFTKRALKLEQALATKPKVLHLEMIGEGEIPADTALLIRSILMKRLP